MPDSGGKYIQTPGQLCGTMYAMTYQFPVDEVFAVKNGYSRKIFKSTGYQIVIITNPADAGIRKEARNYRITVSNRIILLRIHRL